MLNILKDASKRTFECKKRPIELRFMEKVYKNPRNGCWEWIGFKNKAGYGCIGYRDKTYLAHRISYEMYKNQNPEKMHVLHKCDNPPCVNPDHLWLGTDKDNRYDCINKKRNVKPPIMKGEENPFSKLTNFQALDIRKKLKNGYTVKNIAKYYNVHRTCIERIKHGKTYKDAI